MRLDFDAESTGLPLVRRHRCGMTRAAMLACARVAARLAARLLLSAGRPLGSLVPLVALLPGTAAADVSHVVGRGHTIDAIAHRYHVTAKAILDANHLKDPKHLRVGDTLVIPGVSPPAASLQKGAQKGKAGLDAKGKPLKPVVYAMRPKTPGVVHATRLATSQDFTLRVSTRRGKQSPTAAKQAEQMLRSAGGLTHPIEPRLIALLGVVSNHFGSRRVEVISGFRPYTPTQHTAHSNHNIGRAIDFRVVGVPNEVVRDFCRTLKNTGCGYYPNSTFVHMDTRDTSAFWIDYSRPGEAPRYNAANVEADEGTSDVGEESHVAPAAPDAPTAPSEALPPPGGNDTTAPAPEGAPGIPGTPVNPSAPVNSSTPVIPSRPSAPSPTSPSLPSLAPPPMAPEPSGAASPVRAPAPSSAPAALAPPPSPAATPGAPASPPR